MMQLLKDNGGTETQPVVSLCETPMPSISHWHSLQKHPSVMTFEKIISKKMSDRTVSRAVPVIPGFPCNRLNRTLRLLPELPTAASPLPLALNPLPHHAFT